MVTTGTPGQIARFSLPERPETVGAGNFDTNVSGGIGKFKVDPVLVGVGLGYRF